MSQHGSNHGMDMRSLHLSRRARIRPASTAAALLLLAGCGGDGTTEPDPVAPIIPDDPEEAGILAHEGGPVLFDYRRDTVEIAFWVVGGDSLVWSLTPTREEITVDPPGGLAVPGASVVVSVHVDRQDLASGLHASALRLETGAQQDETIPVSVLHHDEDLTLLDVQPTDVVLDRTGGRLFAIVDDPAQLVEIDPGDASSRPIVELPEAPRTLALSPSGRRATIGHRFSVSLVDLDAETTTEYSLPAPVHDVVVGDRGWFYVYSSGRSWQRIQCVEWATGRIEPHTGRSVHSSTTPAMHPSGDFVYGADQGISPADFEVVDIREGVAVYVDDSPYHGSYGIGGRVDVVGGGTRVVSRYGHVFRSAPGTADDMLHVGRLDVPSTAVHVTENAPGTTIVYLTSDAVYLFDTQTLESTARLPIPGLFVPVGPYGGTVEPMTPHQCFLLGAEEDLVIFAEHSATGNWYLARRQVPGGGS